MGTQSLKQLRLDSNNNGPVGPQCGGHYGEGCFRRFWESLGRAVATFGFLEEALGKAIFSFTATEPHDPSQIGAAFEKWLPRLERTLIDSLGNLIGEYEKAVREHPNAPVEDLDYLIWRLREALRIRNVLCHGSWQEPDSVLSNAT